MLRASRGPRREKQLVAVGRLGGLQWAQCLSPQPSLGCLGIHHFCFCLFKYQVNLLTPPPPLTAQRVHTARRCSFVRVSYLSDGFKVPHTLEDSPPDERGRLCIVWTVLTHAAVCFMWCFSTSPVTSSYVRNWSFFIVTSAGNHLWGVQVLLPVPEQPGGFYHRHANVQLCQSLHWTRWSF